MKQSLPEIIIDDFLLFKTSMSYNCNSFIFLKLYRRNIKKQSRMDYFFKWLSELNKMLKLS